MVRFADLRKKPAPVEPVGLEVKPSRYKESPKKPWILAHYALMAGTQKRNARIEKEKFAAKVEAAKLLIKEEEKLQVLDFGEKDRAVNQVGVASGEE